MLCVLILYMSGGTYSLTPIPNDKFLETQGFYQKSADGMSAKKYFHIFILMFDLWIEAFSKLTHYLLDYRNI